MPHTNSGLKLGLSSIEYAMGHEAVLTDDEVADTANAALIMFYTAAGIPQKFGTSSTPALVDQIRRADLIVYARKITAVLDIQAPIITEEDAGPATWFDRIEHSYHEDVTALGHAGLDPRPEAPGAEYLSIPQLVLDMAEVTVEELRATEA